MPRNRPGALRADRTPGPHARPRTRDVPQPPRIRGLSARTSLAIHHVEYEGGDRHLFAGATALALHRYREFLSSPGRHTLYPRTSVCPGCPGCGLDDVRHARDVLDETLRLLPRRPRAELARTLSALDRRYLDRTLPDPRPHPATSAAPATPAPWWHRRLGEGAEGW
ncbi:hypothetical protein OG352_14135 [Streptomyces sp. NBC_01485]|uniref:hypothetical protein n=1 Tax=Streptomyces sp. NBC_01485 TaxID=2903884 RepID=UPI002E313725|nr:hypothetical protein [Streptomyces sp. NBC_01485]